MPKFVVKKETRFEAPVVVREPGSGLAFDFTGVFTVAEVKPDGNRDRDIIECFKGWHGIRDDDVPDRVFAATPENRALLIKQEHVRIAIVRAYLDEITKAPEKNAETPAAAGPPAAATSS